MKWIIAFCCAIGDGTTTDGKMIITPDTVEVFNHKWYIVRESKPVNVTYFKDKAYVNLKMKTVVGSDTIMAYVLIKGEVMVVNIPKLERVVTMNQK